MRKVLGFLLFFCGLIFAVPVPAAPPDGVARLHYHRADGKYEGWGLHVWGVAPDLPAPVDWATPLPPAGSDAFGVYFDVPLRQDAVALNFIVHKGGDKHVPDDQILDFASQGREAWLIAGDGAIYPRAPAITGQSVGSLTRAQLFWSKQPAWLGRAIAAGALLLLALGLLLKRQSRLRAEVLRQQFQLAQSRRDLELRAKQQDEAHARIVALVGTDELTGLMTRAGVRRALTAAQAKARRSQTMLAVLFIDLDDFKPINDNFGHAVGDRVLVAVAERLQASLRESDLLARLGGDEFLVIAEDIGEPLVAAELARKMKAALTEGFEFEARTLRVRASIGVALYPSDGEGDVLVELADAAMYDAKRGGEGGFRFASPWLNAQFEREVEIERRWRDVMNEGSLALGWLPLIADDGAVWAWQALALSGGEAMPGGVGPDPELALEVDLALLARLLSAIDEASAAPQRLVLAPARASLADPGFREACRVAAERLRARDARLVLELSAFPVVPEALRTLVGEGVLFALRLSRPEQIVLPCLAEAGLSHLVISELLSASPEDGRMLQALFAAARALGIGLAFGPDFETALAIRPDYRTGTRLA